MTLIGRLKENIRFQTANTIVCSQSLAQRIKTRGIPHRVHFERSYEGQNILLLALYQRGQLRPDLLNLLTAAKESGLYVIGVNTQKVDHPNQLQDVIDCYIERPNFGRDFGSYKQGFQKILNGGWDHRCQRLLMLNDSVFYSQTNLASFLEQLIHSDSEVIGATENHEIEHHLGSFCIAYSGSILRNPKFQAFWKKYRNTDVRQQVIKRGEMNLSKTLRRCVSAPHQMKALYDLAWLSEQIKRDPQIVNELSNTTQTTVRPDWPRPTIKRVAERVRQKYVFNNLGTGSSENEIKADLDSIEVQFATNATELTNAMAKAMDEKDDVIEERIVQEAKNELLESFTCGSQIHQNAILLYFLGMPIIKADCVYRGMLSISDVENLASRLGETEQAHFKSLLYSRQSGLTAHVGWKRTAWMYGLI